MPGLDPNASSWTAEELLADVRQKARIPAGTLDYTDTVLLEEASRQLWSFAGWAMSSAAGGRQISVLPRSSAAALNSTYAPGREVYLPFDAVGDGFDSIFWVDAQGNETRLQMIDLYTEPLYDAPNAAGMPWGFSILDGRVRLYPKPAMVGTVRINYQRRLPRIVPLASAAVVASAVISAADVVIQVSGSSVVGPGDYFDIISRNYPYRYIMPLALASNVVLTSITTQTYNSSNYNVPLNTGMAMLFAGQSRFVHLPLEFKACFTCKVAAQVLNEIGDAQGAGMLEQKAEAELARVVEMLTPRSQTARTKVVNPYSLMRVRRAARWGGW
jgi:hypothetical protein